LLKYRFEDHCISFCIVFQKGCKCRFLHSFMSTPSTYIHEDRGDNNINETFWFCLDGTIKVSIHLWFSPKDPCCQLSVLASFTKLWLTGATDGRSSLLSVTSIQDRKESMVRRACHMFLIHSCQPLVKFNQRLLNIVCIV
jgi:hypothetical protein